MNPTRLSTLNDEGFRAQAGCWNGFMENSLELLRTTSRILPTPMPEYLDVSARWSRALVDGYAEPAALDGILTEAANEIDVLSVESVARSL